MVSNTLTASIFVGSGSTTNDIDSGEIAEGTITDNDVKNNIFTDNNLANGSVGTLEIANASITTTDISGSAAITNAQVNNDLTIIAGAIDNTVIGGATAAAGSFTTLTATGDATISGNMKQSAATIDTTTAGTPAPCSVQGEAGCNIIVDVLFVTNCADQEDITLPATFDIGRSVRIHNVDGADSVDVRPASGDKINGTTDATWNLLANKSAICDALSTSEWICRVIN
jgi:hypothetical protein